MKDNSKSAPCALKRFPWNRGKMIGAKPPLRQKHVWAIRTKLQIERRTRELAMFNLAIDSKLRGCDVRLGVALGVSSDIRRSRPLRTVYIAGFLPDLFS